MKDCPFIKYKGRLQYHCSEKGDGFDACSDYNDWKNCSIVKGILKKAELIKPGLEGKK